MRLVTFRCAVFERVCDFVCGVLLTFVSKCSESVPDSVRSRLFKEMLVLARNFVSSRQFECTGNKPDS